MAGALLLRFLGAAAAALAVAAAVVLAVLAVVSSFWASADWAVVEETAMVCVGWVV